MSVIPDKLQNLTPQETLSIELNTWGITKLDKIVKSERDVLYICKLEPKSNLKDLTIKPVSAFFRGKHAVIDFDFNSYEKQINNNLGKENCYSLVCDG